jgi:hypothetical protein
MICIISLQIFIHMLFWSAILFFHVTSWLHPESINPSQNIQNRPIEMAQQVWFEQSTFFSNILNNNKLKLSLQRFQHRKVLTKITPTSQRLCPWTNTTMNLNPKTINGFPRNMQPTTLKTRTSTRIHFLYQCTTCQKPCTKSNIQNLSLWSHEHISFYNPLEPIINSTHATKELFSSPTIESSS